MVRFVSLVLFLISTGYVWAAGDAVPRGLPGRLPPEPMPDAPAGTFATAEERSDVQTLWQAMISNTAITPEDQSTLATKLSTLRTTYPCDPWVDDMEALVWNVYVSHSGTPPTPHCLGEWCRYLKEAILKYQTLATGFFNQAYYDRSLFLILELATCYREMFWFYYRVVLGEVPGSSAEAEAKMQELFPLISQTYALLQGNTAFEQEAAWRNEQWMMEYMSVFFPE